MVKSKLDIVQWGPDRLRVGPWRGDARTAYLAPVAGRPAADDTIARCLDVLVDHGYRSVLTSALTAAEQEPFARAGFDVHEHLHLLRHDLRDLPEPDRETAHRLRRGMPFDQTAVLAVDARAFDAFWRFDRDGLADARRATPASRYRVADEDGVVGYAVTGRAGDVGYLQRLAVDPDHHRRGFGTALVVDGLRWALRRGAASVLVNTQESNTRAVALYERLGFRHEPQGLAVLERSLPAAGA
jgi:ribosomal protein S18 acetylase RimI-like enzyme